MVRQTLDSRISLGSDIERRGPNRDPYPETSQWVVEMAPIRTVRVVVGRLGGVIRMSASDIDIFVEQDSIESAWTGFLEAVQSRDDAAWLAFDVGPTRPEEIEEGLNAQEDEDWSQPIGGMGAD